LKSHKSSQSVFSMPHNWKYPELTFSSSINAVLSFSMLPLPTINLKNFSGNPIRLGYCHLPTPSTSLTFQYRLKEACILTYFWLLKNIQCLQITNVWVVIHTIRNYLLGLVCVHILVIDSFCRINP
jgi:hypothetical protein